MEWSNDGFILNDERERIDLARIIEGLRTTYWAKDRTNELIERAWKNSTFCFGLYHKADLIGFARVTSDRAIIAYLSDVFIFPEYRGKGLGEWMCRTIIESTELCDLRWLLNTRDMHGLYKKLGFIDGDPTSMIRRNPVIAAPHETSRPISPSPTLEDASYDAALGELLKLEFFGMKFGLENITKLVEFLGRPERNYKTIHVAGTNGKGSVASMLAAVFQTDGKKVGLYTSPHLIDFRERIKISGEMIPRESLREILKKIWPLVLELNATFFEVTTAIAFEYFSQEKVDIAIIETGLGGTMDATNVLEHPIATVITSIGWDHMEQLGNTLEDIGCEKSGIWKEGVPAVVHGPPELEEFFESFASLSETKLHWLDDFNETKKRTIHSTLPGEHQEQNVRTVLETLRVIKEKPSPKAIRYGIRHVAELTGLRSRLEEYNSPAFAKRGVRLLLDVAHNFNAVEAVSLYFRNADVRPIVVAGFMKDKEVAAMLHQLSLVTDLFIAVQATGKRALESSALWKKAERTTMNCRDGGDVISGVQLALNQAEEGDTVLIVGSHYVVGEFLANESRIIAV